MALWFVADDSSFPELALIHSLNKCDLILCPHAARSGEWEDPPCESQLQLLQLSGRIFILLARNSPLASRVRQAQQHNRARIHHTLHVFPIANTYTMECVHWWSAPQFCAKIIGQRQHNFELTQRGRAADNNCYVLCCNAVGSATDGLTVRKPNNIKLCLSCYAPRGLSASSFCVYFWVATLLSLLL